MHHGNEENKALMVIHPSFIIRLSNSGSQAGWSLSQLSYAERRVTPWTGCTGQTQRETQLIVFSITPTANLDSPVNLTCMPLDCRGEWENPERARTVTGGTCKNLLTLFL